MYAYELLAKLTCLTLTVDNNEEYWEERLQFVGTKKQWSETERMITKLVFE
jgi:hypothetical protein